jgi:SAM-dependent methyltransferase
MRHENWASRQGGLVKSYDDQVREQIEQYAEVTDIHALPSIYHIWSHRFVLPGLRAVFGVDSMADFYAEGFLRGAQGVEQPRFISLGCGDGSVEIEVARALRARGLNDFVFECYDLSNILIGRFSAAIPDELRRYFRLMARDLNREAIQHPYNGVMANQSLHHMVDLEGIFAAVGDCLAPGGLFVTSDIIGRNGHMRWPETKLFVDYFWPLLAERQRWNVQLSRTEASFIDHDCSGEAFEGIRAQDVLSTILASGLQPARFFGFGGFIDPFVDRGFGHGLDPKNDDDVFLVTRVAQINEILLDVGAIKPTMMLAWFCKQPMESVHYRGRTAEAALRDPHQPPEWLAAAVADAGQHPVDPAYAYRGPNADTASLLANLAGAQTLVAEQAERIRAMEASTSWRITAPMRALRRR